MIDQNLTYTRIAERNVSFQLLRTNPKLTTNIKLTVDSGGDLWLNSINANSQLSSQKYKRFAISETSNHEVNLYRFYDNGKTPTSISYQLGSTIGLNAIAKDLKDQYDFDLYTSGAKYLTDKQYSEKFTYFAPIYLDKVLPEKFVIFKIPGASNYTAGAGRELYNNGTGSTQKFATDLFTNAEVIKVFDLSESSKLGKYIHNISKNPMFTQNPLYVNYKDGGYSIYRGASISSGTYVELPELISSVLSRSLPLLKVEQFVTLGFERNNIVHPKILNLEFLFDDITANPYEFNRYFGVYCNDIDLETFEFDLAKMYELSLSENTADNDQTFSTNFTQSDDISFTLTNSTGVKLRGYGLSKNLSDIYYNRTSTNTLFFPYLKTKNNQIHLIKPLSWNQTDTLVDFQLDDNQFDLGLAFGPTDLITQETAELSKLDTKATILIQVFNTPQHLDKLRIYHPSGSMFSITDSGGKYDELVFVSGYFVDNESYSLSYLSSGESVIYVNADKDLEQIAQAIVDIASDFKDSSITGIRMNNHAFIQTQSYGNTFGSLKVRSLEAVSILPKFKINDKVTGDLVFADGGFLNRPHPIIALGNATKLANQLDNIVVKTNQNWSKISRICNLADPIKTGLSLTDQLTAITDFKTKASIQLVDNETIRFDHGKIEIRKNFKPSIGVLSIFETMDFNFSTYTSDYSRNLLLDIYKDFFIPENTLLLDFTKYTYQLVGDGTVNINGIDYSDSATLIWQNTSTISKYNVRSNGPSGKPILIYGLKLPASSSTSSNRLDIPYFDESQDALNYIGPFSIKADHVAIDPTLPTYSYRDKFLQSNLSSEYHAYLENYTTDFAIDGRVIPYITKWGITDSTDVRDNSYRLNSDILFGKDNFGPSHRETSATPEKLTHEWFYIESDFGYTKDISLARNNFYYFDQPLIINELINSDTYFNNYFTYLPTIDGQYNSINNLEYSSTDNIQVGRPQYRYSLLSKNEFSKQYETVFKGSLFRFYELSTSQTPVLNSTRFEDYKFTVLLKPIKEEPNLVKQPVKYRVIENTNSKSITVLIELALGYKSQLNNSIFLEGWINGSESAISQSTLFSGSLKSEPLTYNIDVDSTAISLATYQNQISGLSLVPGLELGQTIHITYIEPVTNRTLSTIIATPGSDVYNAIQLEKIASGDKLGPRVYAKVQKNASMILSTGSYSCSTITAYFEDIWENGNPDLPISSGQIYEQTNYAPVIPGPPSAAEFNSSTTNLIISNTSMTDPSNQYFSDSIGSDQSSKLDKLFSTAALPRFSLATRTGGYYEIFFNIVSQNTPADANTYDINVVHSSGILSSAPGSPAYEEPLIFKADWFIPEYTDSNSLAAANFTVENSVAYYDSMLGDYRIEFNENSVSNLTHSFLYYAKSKKYNNKIDAYSTIKLSRGVNLSSSGIYVNLSLIPEYAETLPLIGLESYDTSADSEINQISTGFAPLYIIKPGEKSILVQRAIGAPLTVDALSSSSYNDGISGAFQNVINFIGFGPALSLVNPLPNALGDIPSFTYTEQSLPSGITLDWIDNANQFQIFGGINYFQKVFENLSFAKFFQLLDKNQDAISWESYTNGILTNYKTLSIEILDADTISKSTVISITPDQVTEGRINTTAGYSLTERPSKPYEVNRYSAEYEIITKPVAGFKYNFSINSNSLPGANICFNPEVDNFFIIPDFEYVKYSTQNILSLENSQNYSAVYPLINETPISRTNFNSLASSWDYNYHFESLNKSESTGVAGSKRVVEDYSFISKLINLPNEFLIEDFTSIELTQSLFNISQAAEADIVYANYPEQVKFKINTASLITKHLSNNGLRSEFQKFFKYEDGSQISLDSDFLGELTFEEFLSQYCLLNLIKLYRVDNFEFYELDDRTIQGNLVEFNQVSYNSLNNLGYDLIKNIRINNTKSRVVEGSILLKPNTGVKLVPKIKIKFI